MPDQERIEQLTRAWMPWLFLTESPLSKAEQDILVKRVGNVVRECQHELLLSLSDAENDIVFDCEPTSFFAYECLTNELPDAKVFRSLDELLNFIKESP